MLVTDGQVGNEDHILRELAPTLRNIKMFTLGIDQADARRMIVNTI